MHATRTPQGEGPAGSTRRQPCPTWLCPWYERVIPVNRWIERVRALERGLGVTRTYFRI